MLYSDVPEGYGKLRAMEGETWEERKANYEKLYGVKVVPLSEVSEDMKPCHECESRQHDESL